MVRVRWSFVLVLGACTVTREDREEARAFDLEPEVGSSSEESGFGPDVDEEEACCYEIYVGSQCCWTDAFGDEQCEPAYDEAKDCNTATGLPCKRVGCKLSDWPECCDEDDSLCWGSSPGVIQWQWCARSDDHECDVQYDDQAPLCDEWSEGESGIDLEPHGG